MKKTVLIAGKPSPVLHNLTGRYLKENFQVSASSDAEAFNPEDQNNSFLGFNLNRRSPLSNRSFVLKTLTQFEKIDEAVVIHSAEGENRPLHELPAASVEGPVDNSIKGVFFFLKEVIGYFAKEGKGTLALVSYTYGLDALTPIDAAAHGSFRGIADSLFTYYRNEPINIIGFESQTSDAEEFASFIYTTLREKGEKGHGRWFKYSDRGGFLSGLSLPGPKKGK